MCYDLQATTLLSYVLYFRATDRYRLGYRLVGRLDQEGWTVGRLDWLNQQGTGDTQSSKLVTFPYLVRRVAVNREVHL